MVYNAWILYIANSGKGEIVTFSSKTTSQNLDIRFNIPFDVNNIKNVPIYVDKNKGRYNTDYGIKYVKLVD